MNRKRWLIAASGILISLVFLWLAFRNLHPEQVWGSIRQADALLLLAGAIWYFAAVTVISLQKGQPISKCHAVDLLMDEKRGTS